MRQYLHRIQNTGCTAVTNAESNVLKASFMF